MPKIANSNPTNTKLFDICLGGLIETLYKWRLRLFCAELHHQVNIENCLNVLSSKLQPEINFTFFNCALMV